MENEQNDTETKEVRRWVHRYRLCIPIKRKVHLGVWSMNERQKVFVEEYMKDMNATQAAIRAGYSEKTARSQGQRLLTKVDIQNAIRELREKIQSDNIATIKDIEEFLSLSMIGKLDEEVIMTVGTGEGFSEVIKERREISLKDRIKAAELLGKRYGIWTEKQELLGSLNVTIVDDIDD